MILRRQRKQEKKNLNISKKTKSSKEVKMKRTVQNAIKYNMMIKNGICILDDGLYSASMRFKDINYQIATDEEQQSIFSKYMEILNSLGQENGLQLTIHNRKLDVDDFEKNIMLNYEGSDLDLYRKELNEMLKDKISKGNNKIVTDKMLTFTIKEDSYQDAKKQLDILKNEFVSKFNDLKCEPEIMDGYNRLETIHNMLNPDNKFFFDYEQCDKNYTSKDAIAPDCLDFKSEGYSMFRINERYAKVMYIKNWATELNDQLIQSLTRLEHNLTISFHMHAIQRGDDLAMIKNQIAKMEMQKMDEQQKALNRGYDPDMLSMDLKYSLEEAYQLKDDVERRNQRLFETQFLVFINAKTKDELNETQKAIETICKKLSCEIGSLSLRQEEGLNAILPIGLSVKYLARTFQTSTCAAIIPFTSQELMQNGVYYGQNTITHNVIVGNRRSLPNPSGWILGMPGYGKSFSAKQELTWVKLGSDDDIIVIDPQAEFIPLANEYKGSIINVDIKSGVHFNPFSGNCNEKNFVKDKGEFGQVMMAEIIGEGRLTPEQKSIVDIAIRKMYEKYDLKLKNGNNGLKVVEPSLDDFYELIKSRDEKLAKEMALALEMYITGGTYDLFSGQNNVDLNNSLTVFNILDLSETLRPLAMKIILETLRSKIINNYRAGKRTWVYIDEIYLLLKDEYSENFLYEFFKWARKFGAVITGITQNVEDLLNSVKARTMLSNSEFIMMLNQSSSDLDELSNLLNLSKEQMSCVSNAIKGSGLLKFGKTMIPFMNEIRKDSAIYHLCNTNFDEKYA